MEKISTGIAGLDQMLYGGIIRNRHIGILGGPGTGKTLFSMQFLYAGAKAGERGYYLSLEEVPEQIVANTLSVFSELKDFQDYINKSIIIEKPDNYTLDNMIELIEKQVVENNAKRVVIDSSTVVEAFFETVQDYRRGIVEFLNLLKTLDCTVYFIVEIESSDIGIKYQLEHYIMDGIINLYNLRRGESRVRAIEIYKMRGINHSNQLVPMRITPSGFVVYPNEKVL
ncbi:MAG: ATPase domain-containing protein [Candidatus Anstonellales archaeon]